MKKFLMASGALAVLLGVVFTQTTKKVVSKAAIAAEKSGIQSGEKFITNTVSKQSSKTLFKEIPGVLEHITGNGFIAKKFKNGAIHVFDGNTKVGVVRGNEFTAIPGYTLKKMNKFLDGKLLPNFKYVIENSYYLTDNVGRVVSAGCKKFDKNILKKQRSPYRQGMGNHPKGGLQSDQGGHIIPNQLGGASEIINIIPQDKALNNGELKKLERFINKNKNNIQDYRIDLSYVGTSNRPDYFHVSYRLNGEEFYKYLKNGIE